MSFPTFINTSSASAVKKIKNNITKSIQFDETIYVLISVFATYIFKHVLQIVLSIK